MKVLLWQWGRRGAGPKVAAAMAQELRAVPGVDVLLSLSTRAELLSLPGAPSNDLPIRTYRNRLGFIGRTAAAPWLVASLAREIRAVRPDVALCAMPAPLDFAMAAALRRARVPYGVVVHDAQLHPGDSHPLQIALQRRLMRGAGLLVALSTHVAGLLRAQGLQPGQPLLLASLPPFVFGPAAVPAAAHGGRFRLLSFGRLLPYKGLDLLAAAMQRLPDPDAFELRVVGSGPESPVLDTLRRLPNVRVENRWVPEAELAGLLEWADGLVLTHREASQSGVAAAAISARRWVVATRVGGLVEQLRDDPMARLCEPEAGSIAAAIGSLPGCDRPAVNLRGWGETATVLADALGALASPSRPRDQPRVGATRAHPVVS